jgi:hypothetical protein
MRLRTLGPTAALALLFALGACGDDQSSGIDGGGAASAQGDTTTPGEGNDPADSAEASKLADAMASGISEASGGQLTDEESQCLAQGILDEVGASDLIRLSDVSFDELDPAMQQKIMSVVLDCVPADKLIAIGQG